MEDLAPSVRRPVLRRLAFIAVYSLLLFGLLEAGAWLAGQRIRQGKTMEEKLANAQLNARVSNMKLSVGPKMIQGDGLHPYLGYMPRGHGPGTYEDLRMVYQSEFYAPDSPLFSKDPNDLVVVFTGGSMAGQFARLGGAESLKPLLEKMPRYKGRKPRFCAIAFGGLKQPQQLMGLTWALAFGARIDLLINLDGFNEVALHEHENERQGVSLYYPRTWFPRVNGEVMAPRLGELQCIRRSRFKLLQGYRSSPFQWSHLRRLAWLFQDRRLETMANQSELDLRMQAKSAKQDLLILGPKHNAKTAKARTAELVDIWARCSLQIERICKANNTKYFHFLQPNQYLTGSKPLGEQEKKVAIHPKSPYGIRVPSGYPMLIERGKELAEEGLRFHDLTQVFADVEEALYKDTCCHVNELGNMLLAQAVGDAIASW